MLKYCKLDIKLLLIFFWEEYSSFILTVKLVFQYIALLGKS